MTDCSNVPSLETVEDTNTNMIVFNEVVTSPAQTTPTAASDGNNKQTLYAKLDALGVKFDDPIPDWAPEEEITELKAYYSPGGDVIIPTAPRPFTTGLTFTDDNWTILQGLGKHEIGNYTDYVCASVQDVKNGKPVNGTAGDILPSVDGQVVYLSNQSSSGHFIWNSSDLSLEVAADVLDGVFIAPSGQTGSTGAWVRSVPDGYLTLGMFGADLTGVIDATEVKVAAYAMAEMLNLNVRWGTPDDTVLITIPADPVAAKVHPKVNTDFGGVNITLNNFTGPDNIGAALLHYAGEESANFFVNAITENDKVLTLTTTGDDVNFTKGDWILIRDFISLPDWKGTPNASVGRQQITQVVGVTSGVLNIGTPAEWDMSTGTYIRKLTDYEYHTKVEGNPKITQIDPGGATVFTSLPGGVIDVQAPQIIRFENCRKPSVGQITMMSGWQLHVVNFSFCWEPYVEKLVCMYPFRPSFGGHGYGVQFYSSHFGLAERFFGAGVRHLVDHSAGYDCGSQYCVAINGQASDFAGHGLSAKRCYSESDSVFSTNVGGWSNGNHSFAADYDFEIRNPKFNMTSTPFNQAATSQGTRVINPVGKAYRTRIFQTGTGAKDMLVEGGKIELWADDAYHTIAYGRDAQDGVYNIPENIKIKGTEIAFTNAGFGKVFWGYLNGNVEIDVVSDGGEDAVVGRTLSSDGITPLVHNTVIIKGRYDNGEAVVDWGTTPTDLLHIEVKAKGFSYRLMRNAPLTDNGNLNIINCDTFGGTLYPPGIGLGQIQSSIELGASVYGNKPNSYDDHIPIQSWTTPLGSATDSINTVNKYAYKQVINTSNDQVLYASGSGVTDTWNDSNGGVVISPS